MAPEGLTMRVPRRAFMRGVAVGGAGYALKPDSPAEPAEEAAMRSLEARLLARVG